MLPTDTRSSVCSASPAAEVLVVYPSAPRTVPGRVDGTFIQADRGRARPSKSAELTSTRRPYNKCVYTATTYVSQVLDVQSNVGPALSWNEVSDISCRALHQCLPDPEAAAGASMQLPYLCENRQTLSDWKAYLEYGGPKAQLTERRFVLGQSVSTSKTVCHLPNYLHVLAKAVR